MKTTVWGVGDDRYSVNPVYPKNEECNNSCPRIPPPFPRFCNILSYRRPEKPGLCPGMRL